MGTLRLDCSDGARKGQLVDQLLGRADEGQRALLLDALGSVAIEGLSATLADGPHLEILIDGRTEAQARGSEGHGHGAHGHGHHPLAEVRAIVESSSLPEPVVADVLGVYDVLAHAEARAHGTDVEGVSFHEVGNGFAIASIIAFCVLMGALAPDRVVATPITTGFGFVDCAHGRLPVPAPATANILEGMPHHAGDAEGELCTPTGAALVRHFTDAFEEGPAA